ncbi:MAG: aminopeptidase [Saprospiraceae bacterium]|nr:aminopeptidase [Saprospiraceae bacterium]
MTRQLFNTGLLLSLLGIMMSVSCSPSQPKTAPESEEPLVIPAGFTFQWEAMASKILERAALQTGEKVLLVGSPGQFDPLISLIRNGVKAAGAEDLGAISVTQTQPPEWATSYTNGAEGKNQRELEEYFSTIDLGIMMPGAQPSDLAYRSIQNVLTSGPIRTIHFHWSGAYELDLSEKPIDETVNTVYQHALLATDYNRLGQMQKLFEADARGVPVNVTTPAGTDITFRIGDRPVTRQDGDASAVRARRAKNLIDREIELPAGAVRVAPVESTVNGVIRFPDSDWNGTRVTGLRMMFKAGKLTDWSADSGSEAVQAELDRGGAAARSFREFALGFNPLLAIPAENPWIPYYGYGAGVVRLSLGDNTELGGNVGGGYVRWNFFTDATVTVRDEVWVRDGRLVVQ